VLFIFPLFASYYSRPKITPLVFPSDLIGDIDRNMVVLGVILGLDQCAVNRRQSHHCRIHQTVITCEVNYLAFLADRTNGRCYATVLRPSVAVVRDVMYCG